MNNTIKCTSLQMLVHVIVGLTRENIAFHANGMEVTVTGY